MSGHTQGPWTADDLYVKARGYRVATVHVGTSSAFDGSEHDGRAESYADAQLIAAAPAMLEANHAALTVLAMVAHGKATPEHIAAAIEKVGAAIASAEAKR
jgi:hypothetical protein